MCYAWCHKSHCTKRQLQSLLGSLLYVSKFVQRSRFFLNHLLDILCYMEDRCQVPLTMEAKREIYWFIQFLPRLNGSMVTFFDCRPINVVIELDTGLQGLEAMWRAQVYSLMIPLWYLGFKIVPLKMFNILAAFRVWHN